MLVFSLEVWAREDRQEETEKERLRQRYEMRVERETYMVSIGNIMIMHIRHSKLIQTYIFILYTVCILDISLYICMYKDRQREMG